MQYDFYHFVYYSSLQTHKKLHPRKPLLLFQPDLISQYQFLSRIHTTILHPTFNDQSSIWHYSAAGCQVSTPLQFYPLHPFVPTTRPKTETYLSILSYPLVVFVEVVLPFAATFCIQYHSIHEENLLAQTGNMTTLNYHNIYCARAKLHP